MRRLVPFFAVLVLLAAASFVPIQGPWANSVFSRLMSTALGLRVETRAAKIRGWREVTFDSVRVGTRSSSLFDSGPGRVVFDHTVFFPQTARIHLARVFFSERSLPAMPFIGKNTPSFGPYDTYFLLTRVRSLPCLRVINFQGSDLRIRGGILFEQKGLKKTDLRITLSDRWLRALPETFVRRLSREKGGGRSMQLLFSKGILTLRSSRAPLFTAEWS